MAKRIPQVNSLLQRELNQIFLREIEFPKGVLVTLTRAESAADLYHARVYISVMPENETEKVLRILSRRIYRIQQLLNKKLRMRPIPKIMFCSEKETGGAAKIEELLEELKKEEK